MDIFWTCFLAFASFQLALFIGFLLLKLIRRVRSRKRRVEFGWDNLADQIEENRCNIVALAERVGFEPAAPWDHPHPRWVKLGTKKPLRRRRMKSIARRVVG